MESATDQPRRERRLNAVARDLLDDLRRRPPGDVRTSISELAQSVGSSRAVVRSALVNLARRGLVTWSRVQTDGGRPVGVSVRMVDGVPVRLENETDADDELDAHLIELTRDPSHPRHMDACAAHLLRHGRDRGWVGIAPPRTKAEFETAWPPKPANEPAGTEA